MFRPREFVISMSKIKRFVPGYQATIPFKQGIKRTLAWFEADPARMVINAETHAMMDRIIEAYEGKYLADKQ